MSRLWPWVRPLAFSLAPERAHRLTLGTLSRWSTMGAPERPRDPAHAAHLSREQVGLTFKNPIGLAAGLDKDAEAVEAWQRLGFGSVEVGTVTAHAQPGNPQPRLFRLRSDQALMNRMGFNNHGAEAMRARLTSLRERDRVRVPLGVNLGKSKVTPAEEAAADYEKSASLLAPLADYLVVNVSSPNTPGLRDLQKIDELLPILEAVLGQAAKCASAPPVLVKLAPDLDDASTVVCSEAALEAGAAGLILSNTTISRENLRSPIPEGPGGISGPPVFDRSTEQLRAVRSALPKAFLIGVGGISSADRARQKLDAGADLLQVYTGFIYGGPGFVRSLLSELWPSAEDAQR